MTYSPCGFMQTSTTEVTVWVLGLINQHAGQSCELSPFYDNQGPLRVRNDVTHSPRLSIFYTTIHLSGVYGTNVLCCELFVFSCAYY